jgi:hypothetical protein
MPAACADSRSHGEDQNERCGAPTRSQPASRREGRDENALDCRLPRWVKVFVITALGLALLMVVAMLLSGGQHGPGRHLSSAGFDTPVVYSAKAASFFSGDDASALSGR